MNQMSEGASMVLSSELCPISSEKRLTPSIRSPSLAPETLRTQASPGQIHPNTNKTPSSFYPEPHAESRGLYFFLREIIRGEFLLPVLQPFASGSVLGVRAHPGGGRQCPQLPSRAVLEGPPVLLLEGQAYHLSAACSTLSLGNCRTGAAML